MAELRQNTQGDNRSSPVQVPGTTWSANFDASNDNRFAIKTDGTLWSWGYNGIGQLGVNNKTQYSSPVQIPGTTWSKVDAGDATTMAVKTDGTLWSWGYNNMGQLAQNNTTQRSSPIQIPGTTWSMAASRGFFSIALKTDGTMWAWGKNHKGQLGLNSVTSPTNHGLSSPVQVPGTTWSHIEVTNKDESYALKTDGTLWSWGNGGDGRLGHDNETEYSSPVQVGSDTSWYSIKTGGSGGNGGVLAIKQA